MVQNRLDLKCELLDFVRELICNPIKSKKKKEKFNFLLIFTENCSRGRPRETIRRVFSMFSHVLQQLSLLFVIVRELAYSP